MALPTDPAVQLSAYDLGRQISQSQFTEVFRATTKSSEQQVVVKRLRPEFTPDSTIGLRFQKGLALHASIVHPNVVPLLDRGLENGRCFAVEPYLAGGNLLDRVRRGLALQQLLKYVKDVARALDAIHAHRVVHCDVKPENIMVSANGVAHLIDFGCAVQLAQSDRMADAAQLEPVKMKLGTPEYMSPELAAGQAVEGQADIYSLGVTFFQMLTGQLPYVATDDTEIANRHAQETVPRLPEHLAAFQSVVDKALAKKPDDRFASGQAMVLAIDNVRTEQDLPELRFRTQPIVTREITHLTGGMLATPRDPARLERQSSRVRRQRRIRNTASVLVLAGVLAGGYFILQSQTQLTMDDVLTTLGIGENPELISAWNEAQALRQDPNQDLAAIVAAYRRVLAIDPEHPGATGELRMLATDWQTSISQALNQNALEVASTRLAEANAVFPEDVQWIQLATQLQDMQRAQRILTSTRSLLASHGLSDIPSATAAIQSYHEVLRLAPEQSEAREALRELSEHYAQLASTAVRQGRLNDGIGLLERATAADANVPQLDGVRKLISQATEARAAIDDLLQQARRLRSQGQLMVPAGENAAELYQRVLATDPANAIAAQGLEEIATQVATNANLLLGAGALAEVDTLLAQAQAASLPEASLAQTRRRLDEERQRRDLVARNLADAQALMSLGYLTQPAEANAVAKLREIQQVDPGNAQAAELMRECAQRLAAVALEAYEHNMEGAAKQYLDLALAITPDVESWNTLRESWEGTQPSE